MEFHIINYTNIKKDRIDFSYINIFDTPNDETHISFNKKRKINKEPASSLKQRYH